MRKMILLVMFLAFSCIFAFAQENVLEKQEGVNISYTRLVSYMQVMGEDGRWGPPDEKVSFDEDYGKNFSITAKAGGKELECPVVWQDVAYFLGGNGEREGKLAIFGYKGCPFTIEGELEPVKNIEMRSEIKIEIDSASGNILWISPTSARPFANTGGQLSGGCEMLRNVVWVFNQKGITFNAKTAKYLVEKPGAAIRFTKDGVVMDGIRKIGE